MMKKWKPKCDCGMKKSYIERYDAYACFTCNKWDGKRCEDAECSFCRDMPETPKDLKSEKA